MSQIRPLTTMSQVFGEVMSGMDVVYEMETMGSSSGHCRALVKIEDCGLHN